MLLPDLLMEDLDIVFCGINPAASAARSGHNFSHPNNRFWRVLHLAGFTPHLIPSDEDQTILQYGYGLTAAVQRSSARANEVAASEFRAGAQELETKIRLYRPQIVAFLGKVAFAAIFNKKTVEWGHQDVVFGDAMVWIVPNPSGLNRAFTLDALVSSYRQLREARDQLPYGGKEIHFPAALPPDENA